MTDTEAIDRIVEIMKPAVIGKARSQKTCLAIAELLNDHRPKCLYAEWNKDPNGQT
jgi:hypothetical protein